MLLRRRSPSSTLTAGRPLPVYPDKQTFPVSVRSALPLILLQKSKIQQPKKSRESRFLDFSVAASLFSATAKVGSRFLMKRHGHPCRRARNASAVIKLFVRHPQKNFYNLYAPKRHGSTPPL